MALHQQGRFAEAEKLYREVLQQTPRRFDVLYLLGLVAIATNRHVRGIDLISKSIKQNPNFPPAHCSRGIALAAIKRHTEALADFDRATTLDPRFAEAFYARGITLRDLMRDEDAVASFSQTVALNPRDAEAFNNLGCTLNSLKRYTEALNNLDKAIALRPLFAEAYCNRGNSLLGLKRPSDALISYDKALAFRPNLPEAHCNRGDALHELNRLQDALASFDNALALRPDFAEAHFGKSLILLTLGHYDTGFKIHEWRKQRLGATVRSFSRPLWLGETDIAGQTLFIHPELFLGDMIQFCRYAVLAERRGAKVVLASQRSLHQLLKTLSPTITLLEEQDEPVHYDWHCPLMSLPLAFGTTTTSVPAPICYLYAEQEQTARWKQRIGDQGFKVGICWQGSATSVEADRAFHVSNFFEISRYPGLRLISLQAGAGVEQLAGRPDGMKVEDFSVGGGLLPFADVAAIMQNLDLIITCDTVTAHLAGALGRPTWVALKQVPDWRWGLHADTTPWYPTLRLFRQASRQEWTSVFSKMHAVLERDRLRLTKPQA